MHAAAANASCGCLVYAPTPQLMPPIGALAGWPALTPGYGAQPMFLKMSGAFVLALG